MSRMSEQERKEVIEQIKRICKDIGCSGKNADCPGDPFCSIIYKFMGSPKKAEVDSDQ